MIQFNLLPDVKLEFVKATRLKHAVSVIAVIAAGVALSIMVLLILTVDIIQKKHMNDLSGQITSITKDLKNTPNLNQVLTVQGQVNALPALHGQKPVTTRLSGFVESLTPSKATISHLNVSFQTNLVTITGAADSLATVNQFVDTLKLTSYTSSSSSVNQNAFSNVVLTAFSYNTTNGASYTITASFDPLIFSGTNSTVTLNVPSNDSTHSTGGQTFQAQPSSTKTNGSTSN